MPKFTYKAKKGPAELVDGTIEAENLDRAVDKIINLGYAPIDVFAGSHEERPTVEKTEGLSFDFYRQVKLSDKGLFLRQLYDLVDARVPILRALNIVLNQTRNPHFKDLITKIHTFVQDGGTLSEAMAQYPQIFSPFYVNLVKSGEIGGNLEVVLGRLADFIEKDIEMRSKVKSSLIYPALILLVGCLTIFILLTFVVPRLTVIFDDMAESLPWATLILIGISNFFARFWWLIMAIALMGSFYLRRFSHSPEGRLWLDKQKLMIPIFGNFIQEVEIARFARTLSTLLESGVVIVNALESVQAVLENEILKQEIKNAAKEVAGGSSLHTALQECPYFPEEALTMITVGEESGRLEQSLNKLADSFEHKSDRSIKIVTTLIEPVMILLVGSIVFFIVMAVVLPIFKMNQMIR